MAEKMKPPKISLEEAQEKINQEYKSLDDGINLYLDNLKSQGKENQELNQMDKSISAILDQILKGAKLDQLLENQSEEIKGFFSETSPVAALGRFLCYQAIVKDLLAKPAATAEKGDPHGTIAERQKSPDKTRPLEKNKIFKATLKEAQNNLDVEHRALDKELNLYLDNLKSEHGKTNEALHQIEQDIVEIIEQALEEKGEVIGLDKLLENQTDEVKKFFDVRMVPSMLARYRYHKNVVDGLPAQSTVTAGRSASQEATIGRQEVKSEAGAPKENEATTTQAEAEKEPVENKKTEQEEQWEVEKDTGPDVMTPWEKAIGEKAEALKRKLAIESRLPPEQITAAKDFLTQEADSLVKQLCLDWFAINEPFLLDEKGLSGNISDDRKVELALQNNALDAIRKNENGDYGSQQEDLEQLENLSAVLKKIQSEAPGLEDKYVVLHLVDKKCQQPGDIDASLLMLRRALAENISGKNFEEEKFRLGGADLSSQDLEQQEILLGDRESYINIKPALERKKDIENRQKVAAMSHNSFATDAASADLVIAARKTDCKKTIDRDLSEQDIIALEAAGLDTSAFKRAGFWRWKKINTGDGHKYKAAQFDEILKSARESITNTAAESLRQELELVGSEWDGKKAVIDQVRKEVQTKIEAAVTKLAQSPDQQSDGIKASYERIKDSLLDDLIEDLAQADPKTQKELEAIEKQFEGKGQDASKLFREAFERKGAFKDLTGDITKDRDKLITALGGYGFDDLTSGSFVDKWAKTYNNDFKKKRSWWKRLLGIGAETIPPKKKKTS